MAPMYDEGPEVAPQSIPEVYHPPQAPTYHSPHQHPVTPIKREDSMYPGYIPTPVDQSVYGGQQSAYQASQVDGYNEAAPAKKSKKTFCGCTFLVLVLSVIICVLAIAVIGLAAGTGIEANRANQANEKLASLTASPSRVATKTVTATSAPTASSLADLSNGCSPTDTSTTGQTYTTQFFGTIAFTMFCNKNAPNPPLMSLFTADFSTCMDACAAYSDSIPKLFGQSTNATCEAVSFIPLWTTKQGAIKGGAPGNCYLKPGPQRSATLEQPNIGTDCHAAILTGN